MRRAGASGPSAAAIFAIYKARVIADGGVVENDACTIEFLVSIGAGDAIPAYQIIYDEYYARVLADGGTFENIDCTITFLQEIII